MARFAESQVEVAALKWMSGLRYDVQHREAGRARMRMLVRRILRKYGYPPNHQDDAVQTFLQQAELFSVRWAV